MNYKGLFGICGIVMVIGGIIYFLNSRKNESNLDKKNTDLMKKTNTIVTEGKEDEFDLKRAKEEVSDKISQRHEEAKEIMEKAVSNIFDESNITETKNEEAKKKIFDDLNDI